MANGWAHDGAVHDQIESSIQDAISEVRNRLPEGEGAEECEACGEDIPEARRKALPGVRFCVECQSKWDKVRTVHSLYNRRANKDSQLR